MESSVLLTPVIEARATRPIARMSSGPPRFRPKNSTMKGMEIAMMMTPDAPGTIPVKPATKTAMNRTIQ